MRASFTFALPSSNRYNAAWSSPLRDQSHDFPQEAWLGVLDDRGGGRGGAVCTERWSCRLACGSQTTATADGRHRLLADHPKSNSELQRDRLVRHALAVTQQL